LAIAEAPIDALSLAVLEQHRADTLYVATGGGMGPGTIEALQAIIAKLGTSQTASSPVPPTRIPPATATPTITLCSLARRACGSSGCGRRKVSISTAC
jgi:hypothetical protein